MNTNERIICNICNVYLGLAEMRVGNNGGSAHPDCKRREMRRMEMDNLQEALHQRGVIKRSEIPLSHQGYRRA